MLHSISITRFAGLVFIGLVFGLAGVDGGGLDLADARADAAAAGPTDGARLPIDGGQCPDGGEVIESGCVGECGPASVVSHRVPEDTEDLQIAVGRGPSSLCPNTGAIAEVFIEGDLVFKFDITDDDAEFLFPAHPGQLIMVAVSTFNTGDEIRCVRLGELIYRLRSP